MARLIVSSDGPGLSTLRVSRFISMKTACSLAAKTSSACELTSQAVEATFADMGKKARSVGSF